MTVPESESTLGRGELQRRAVDGVVWNLLNLVVALPVSFVANVLIARALGVVDVGRLAVLTAVVEILTSVLGGGLGQAVTQYGARAHASGDVASVVSLLRGYQGLRLALEFPVYAIAYAALADVPLGLKIGAIIVGLAVPAVVGNGAACFTIENRTGTAARLVLVTTLLSQPVIVAVAMWSASADDVWLARMVTPVGLALASLAFVTPTYRRAMRRPIMPPRFPVGVWRFAGTLGVAAVVGGLVMSRSEVFALTAWSTPQAAGLYAIAFGLVAHVLGPAQAIVGPLVPALAGLRAVDGASLGRALARTLRAMSALAGALTATAIPVIGPLVPVLYGPEFAAADPLVVAVGGAACVAALAGPLAAVVLSRLAGGALLRVNLSALIVDVGMMIALIPVWGVWGAVLANGCAGLVRAVLLLRTGARDLGLPAVALARAGLPSVLGAGWAGLAWTLAGVLAPDQAPQRAVLGALIGAIGFVVALAVTRSGLTGADIDAVVGPLPRRLASPGRLMLRALAWSRPT